MTGSTASLDAEVPLNTVLANTGAELERLARVAADVDDHIGDLLLHPETAARLSPALMQDVDRLRQAVDCLHRLIANIADAGCTEARVSVADATRGVYLESIRRAVTSGVEPPA